MLMGTFFTLCKQLGPYTERQARRMREPVEVERQVSLTLYYLGGVWLLYHMKYYAGGSIYVYMYVHGLPVYFSCVR